MTTVSAADDLEVLWLATLQRAIGRASHDVKDALNGVSVNLEVVRGRAARPDVAAAAVAPFAEAAGQQLERLTILVEAVLALGRAERQPADVGLTLRRVAALCGASSSATDAAVLVELDGLESASTSVPGTAVRLALAAPLLDLVAGDDRTTRAAPVRCVGRERDGTIVVTMAAEGRRAAMPDGVADAVRAAGVRWTDGGSMGTRANDLSLVFPRG
jgi:signal transduction histidine kinase